jgi:hypothetical protein
MIRLRDGAVIEIAGGYPVDETIRRVGRLGWPAGYGGGPGPGWPGAPSRSLSPSGVTE